MKKASIIAAIFFVCALGAFAIYADTALARDPDCPSSWPEQPVEQFFTDSDGAEWFVIRSADSNGYETVRAYRADDRYQAGYVPGSPNRVCYLLVRRPGNAADLPEAQQLVFRAESEAESAPAVAKTLFRQFYDRLIPAGPYGPNPDPKWGDLFGVFSNEERSCIAAVLGEEGLANASQSSVFHEGEPRLQDVLIFGCLSHDTAGALTFAIAFSAVVHEADAIGEENACVQELLELIVSILSKPFPTEEDLSAVLFGLIACALEAAGPESSVPGGQDDPIR